jgi:hypothetical protein
MADNDKAAQNGHGDNGVPDDDAAIDQCFEAVRQERTILLEANAIRKAAYRRIADAYATLKKTTGISRRRAELKLEIEELEKDEDRESAKSEIFKLFRRDFEQLKQGETGDMLRATGQEPAAKPAFDPTAEPTSVKQARAAGRESGRAGKPSTASPHHPASDLGVAWAGGWVEGQGDIVDDMRRTSDAGDRLHAH